MSDEDTLLLTFIAAPIVLAVALWKFHRKWKQNAALPAWAGVVVGNLLVLSWLFALLLLGGEIYYRFFCDRSDALCFTKVSERWFQRHFKLNGGDCRDNIQYAVEIAPGMRRLSFLGLIAIQLSQRIEQAK